MRISAQVRNSLKKHEVQVKTNDSPNTINIPPKSTGFGSSINGGELLFLALATCYCNDLYREAAKRGMRVEQVEVEVEGDFGAEGTPARDITYRARVKAEGSETQIRELMQATDQIAEIHNTLRAATPVRLSQIEIDPM